MKALVIEDTATSQAVICHLLERLGIQPVQARDGPSGIAGFEQEKPDLILLDIILPGIDGFEVARRICALEKPGEWTPIIFLTALSKDEDLERGIEAGGDDYLLKPVSEVVLGAKVRAMQRIMEGMPRLVGAADWALYEAKRQGRNCVQVAGTALLAG